MKELVKYICEFWIFAAVFVMCYMLLSLFLAAIGG